MRATARGPTLVPVVLPSDVRVSSWTGLRHPRLLSAGDDQAQRVHGTMGGVSNGPLWPQTEPDLSALDPLTAAISVDLRRLDAICERQGWDQPASLWAVRRAPQPGDAPGRIRLSWDRQDLGPIEADERWAVRLQRVAQLAGEARLRGGGPIPDLVALAGVTEAWAVSAGGDTIEQEQVREAAFARQLHQRPDRLEIRMITAVDIDGNTFAHAIGRDTAQVPRSQMVHRAGSDDTTVVDGDVAALTALLAACGPDPVKEATVRRP